jgi:hypothetical protein
MVAPSGRVVPAASGAIDGGGGGHGTVMVGHSITIGTEVNLTRR